MSTNTDAASQALGYSSIVIQQSLGLSADDVQTFCLQVFKPDAYKGPDDRSLLLTTWMGYISSDSVSDLENMIVTKTSPFYQQPLPAGAIAAHVNPAFQIASVSVNPPDANGDPVAGNDSGTGGSSNSSKTREDIIIGVVSSLGAITLLVLAFLIVRAIKQRRELAHRRLSDPPQGADLVGSRPDNQDFDRDSVGGQRRRSFYYAEDSLRGYQDAAPGQYDNTVTQDGMRERRPVNANMIGAPILRDNTLNW